MELAVLTITAIGIFLFSISYIKFAYEGFRHHFVTGLLALIPVINLIALPTLWDRTRTQTIPGNAGISTIITNEKQNGSAETFLSLLPGKALYRLDFESASPNQIRSFAGRIVRITSNDHTVTDGRIQNFTQSSVFIEQPGDGNIAYELMLSNIKSIDVMVKRAAR